MSRFRLTSPRVKLSENDVERACLDLLRFKGFDPRRLHVGLFHPYKKFHQVIEMGEAGIPDYVIPRFYVEVKRPGGTLSDVQRRRIFELKQAWNLETAVVESIDELADWLRDYEKRAGAVTGP